MIFLVREGYNHSQAAWVATQIQNLNSLIEYYAVHLSALQVAVMSRYSAL